MTRIKKRRSGKNKTADQQRTAAGRRRARKAEKPITAVPGEQVAASETVVKQPRAPKKKFGPAPAGRRGVRAAKKAASTTKEYRATDNTTPKNTAAGKNPSVPSKATGKTRSAGSRRVAVAKSVANTFNKKTAGKKTVLPGKETAPGKKQGKGFAPWNKNKFKKKNKDNPAG